MIHVMSCTSPWKLNVWVVELVTWIADTGEKAFEWVSGFVLNRSGTENWNLKTPFCCDKNSNVLFCPVIRFWSPKFSYHIFSKCLKWCFREFQFTHIWIIFPGHGHNHEHTAVASNAEKVSLKTGAEIKVTSDNGLASSAADAAEDELEEVNIDSIRGKPKMRTLCLYTIKLKKHIWCSAIPLSLWSWFLSCWF